MDMKFNKKNFEFYMSDDSVVQAYQIEGGDVWTLEIFPKDQSEESFNAGEFDGWLKFYKEPFRLMPYSEPSNHMWNIQKYPKHWTKELKEEFFDSLEEEIKDIEIIE